MPRRFGRYLGGLFVLGIACNAQPQAELATQVSALTSDPAAGLAGSPPSACKSELAIGKPYQMPHRLVAATAVESPQSFLARTMAKPTEASSSATQAQQPVSDAHLARQILYLAKWHDITATVSDPAAREAQRLALKHSTISTQEGQ